MARVDLAVENKGDDRNEYEGHTEADADVNDEVRWRHDGRDVDALLRLKVRKAIGADGKSLNLESWAEYLTERWQYIFLNPETR